MFIVGMLSWWYGGGLKWRLARFGERLAAMYDFFSIDLLLKSLFAPFRQISAGPVDGPLALKLRAFFDRLISRVIGAIVRLFVLLAGVISLVVTVVVLALALVFWLVLPILPIIGLVVALTGWVPVWK